jgi:glycosyltransferase involved in cell wall biosynthesis
MTEGPFTTRSSASEPIRLLLVITLSETGGATKYVSLLAQGVAADLDVVVAARGHGPLEAQMRAADVRYVPLRHMCRPIRPWSDALAVLELVRLFRRDQPHIVHANSSKAGVIARIAAWLSRVPVRMFTVHGWAFSAHSGVASAAYRWADWLMCRLTTFTICVSESDLREGLRARTCLPGRSAVVRNAVAVPERVEARAERATPLLVTVGRFQRPKDFTSLLRALSMLDKGSYRAELVGDGPLRGAVEAEIAGLGLANTVTLRGELARADGVLAAADVFVLSSDSEGFPMSILEAMAAALPVVATAVGGIPELVINGETGLLVPARDPASFAHAIRTLLGDGELRRRMGEAGRERVRASFDLATFLRAHVEIYEALVADRRGR